MVMPILKRGGKALLQEGLHTGLNIARDVVKGDNIKSATRKRVKQAGKNLLVQAKASSSRKRKSSAVTPQSQLKRRKGNSWHVLTISLIKHGRSASS